MKTFRKKLASVLIWLLSLGVGACGGATGGTETGTTDPGLDTTNIADRIEATADALVPLVVTSDGDSSVSPAVIKRAIDGTSEEWDAYLDPDDVYVLTDVFGSPDDDPAPVTRIRVLMDQFRATLDGIFSEDPNITCEGAADLTGGDVLDVAFYGSIANGTAGDRRYDCITEQEEEEDDHYVTLYGADSDNVVRVASMYDVTNDNIWFPEERGNILRNLQVVIATYAEGEEEGTTIGFLDIQYAQASIYSGLDDDLEEEEDNVLFKSRTRITGRATLDEEGEPVDGTGDFTVTKYDRGVNEDDVWEFITKSNGRGSYGEGNYSLFKIDSDASSLEGMADTFCIQMPEDGTDIPAYASAANCTALETAFAWGVAAFPAFDLTPALSAVFDVNPSYEGDDTDLIANNGSNFEIPTYE